MQVKISVDQIKIWAYHGVYHEERVSGRYFLIDVTVDVDVDEQEILTDQVSSTYNYEWIASIVQEEMKESCALLEKKAILMAQKIKSSDHRIQKVRLKMSKTNPPLPGEIGSTSVEIFV